MMTGDNDNPEPENRRDEVTTRCHSEKICAGMSR